MHPFAPAGVSHGLNLHHFDRVAGYLVTAMQGRAAGPDLHICTPVANSGAPFPTCAALYTHTQGLNLHHFDKVAGYLVTTMEERGVPAPMIDEAAEIIMGLRPLFDPERYGCVRVCVICERACCECSLAALA